MQYKSLLPLALGASSVAAQSLTEIIAANNASLSLLSNLIAASPGLLQLLDSTSNITILAPSNAAIAAFLNSSAGLQAGSDPGALTELLGYHVLNGTYPSSAVTNDAAYIPTLLNNVTYTNVTGGQVVEARSDGQRVTFSSGLLQTSNVVTADVNFTGGIIHVIDSLLTIPPSISVTAGAANLTALAGALNQAGIADTVDGLHDVTVFAPTNAAFAAIASATQDITDEALATILQYHVVQGSVIYSTDIENGTTLRTLQGGNVTITVIDDEIYVNSARVIGEALVANGVVHIIDGVLNPNNSTAAPHPGSSAPAFPGATPDGSTPFTPGNNSTSGRSGGGAATNGGSTGGAARAIQTGAVGVFALLAGAIVFAANL